MRRIATAAAVAVLLGALPAACSTEDSGSDKDMRSQSGGRTDVGAATVIDKGEQPGSRSAGCRNLPSADDLKVGDERAASGY